MDTKSGIEKNLAELEQELLGLKTGNDTTADSAIWHRFSLDLGSPSTQVPANQKWVVHTLKFVAATASNDLMVRPVLSRGVLGVSYKDNVTSRTTRKLVPVGRIDSSVSDPYTMSVVFEYTTYPGSSISFSALHDAYLIVYSNYELELMSHTTQEFTA